MAIAKQLTIYLCLVVFALSVILIHSFYISDYQSYKKQLISFSSFNRTWKSVSKKV